MSKTYYYISIPLEKAYAVTFTNEVKTILVSTCRDRSSGGLGNFIEIIELVFSFARPEWEDISWQIIEDTGRILHTNDEAAQSFTALKPRKKSVEEKNSNEESSTVSTFKPTSNRKKIDISALPVSLIDKALLTDAMRHKSSM